MRPCGQMAQAPTTIITFLPCFLQHIVLVYIFFTTGLGHKNPKKDSENGQFRGLHPPFPPGAMQVQKEARRAATLFGALLVH